MPKMEDGGFLLDDSGLSPYSADDESEKEDEENNDSTQMRIL